MARNVAPATLGHVLADAEAQLFVGRTKELARLAEAVGAAAERPVVLYLHGPGGIGKTALLRAYRRIAEECGMPVVAVDLAGLAPTPEALLQELSERLGAPSAGAPLAWPTAVVDAIHRRAGRPGACVLILLDGYDALVGRDTRLRREVFHHLQAGVALVLAGRTHPADLWADDPYWRAAVSEVPLGPLDDSDAAALLARVGLAQAAGLRHCIAVGAGRPALLGLAAAVWMPHLRRTDDPSFGTSATDRDKMDSAVVERFIHPHTRRLAWRAGTGTAHIDRLVAAACIQRGFDRQALTAVAGAEAVAAAWPQLVAQPFVEQVQGLHRVVDGARQAFAGVVRRQRPWAEHVWRKRALAHHLGRLARRETQPLDVWPEIVHLLRGARTEPSARGAEEEGAGWAWRWGAAAADVPAIQACWGLVARRSALSGGTAADAVVARLAAIIPDALLQARDGEGRLLGCGLFAPLDAETAAALAGVSGATARGTGGGAVHLALQVAVAEPRPGLADACVSALCAGLAGAAAQPADLPLPRRMGLDPLSGAAFDAAAGLATYVRRLSTEAFVEWLQTVIAEPLDGVPPPEARAGAVRAALRVLSDERRLAATVLGRFYAADGRLPPGTSLYRLVLDALATAELGDSTALGRDILTLYYVERVGSHEQVAERLSLPRTTYFRYHRDALVRLGDALFRLEEAV